MMKFEEYRQLDGVALAALVANKDITASELLEVAIARAEQVNPVINGLSASLYESARETAQLPLKGALAGVPMLVKDYYQEIAGAPHYMGNKGLKRRQHVASEDSELVKRWRQAGLVLFGRTTTPELAIKGVTEAEATGLTRNPWNLQHTPGGSSGGSAALVAAGVVPVAGANDGGGSIRIPAAACGLFGLKPGRGRVPFGPSFVEAMHGMAVNHVVTRTVRDSAVWLDIAHGEELGSLTKLEKPTDSYFSSTLQPPPPLRIAFSTKTPIGTAVDREAIRAVERSVTLLQDLGHIVEEAAPPIDGLSMMQDWLRLWFVNAAETVERLQTMGLKGSADFEVDTLILAAVGRGYRALDYVQSYLRLQRYGIEWDRFMQHYDVFLTPTLASPPAPIGALATPSWQQKLSALALALKADPLIRCSGLVERMALDNLRYTPFTQLANIIGVPAMSVPLHWCDNGLPLGVQFIGTQGDEAKLLSLAAQLEQSQPWFHRVPMECIV